MVELKDIISLVIKAGQARELAGKFAYTSVMARRMNDLAEQYEAELLILYEMLTWPHPEPRYQDQAEVHGSPDSVIHESRFPERLPNYAVEVARSKLRCPPGGTM